MISSANSVPPPSSLPEYDDSEADIGFDDISLPQSGWITISCTPGLSTPLGFYHIAAGLLCSLVNVCRMVGAFFSYQWEYGVGPYAKLIPEGHTVSILGNENKERLFESVDTIARGILETIPVIGNFAMYHSKWRFAPIFLAYYEPRRQQCLRDVSKAQEDIERLKTCMAFEAIKKLDTCLRKRKS